jgi:hypothetical protein
VYLDIAKALKHPVRVVKDNDNNYQKNIVDWRDRNYGDCPFIQCLSPNDNSHNSLEPALIAANCATLEALNALAQIMLSQQTFALYAAAGDLAARRKVFAEWYAAKDGGGKKVDSAIRIFDSTVPISYPTYLIEAVAFAS